MPSSFCPEIKEHHRTAPFKMPSRLLSEEFSTVEPITPFEDLYDADMSRGKGTGMHTQYGSRIIITENPTNSETIEYCEGYINFTNTPCLATFCGESIEGTLTGAYFENCKSASLMFTSK